ncbi:hypothetical protein MPTK1_6g19310 [Marchantia polymorpha subsp. ruderalis]|uniref:Uncharacterized protein n=2 Tax=Marchantia polymorpha TaxID=3197 RepID=A0AAF6BTR6_MARPO|nr:hypothetical protein MARPO_0045s0132 [Marchantia polymorpha]BBN15400.1 hypothetical protein Mp_6g19310 [Marchantia polymorpha subsp. ruderalis]|eukprot:PTQ39488.1 hypothetical protein MARPO_0045s0132 [Marchantia polymorpha]
MNIMEKYFQSLAGSMVSECYTEDAYVESVSNLRLKLFTTLSTERSISFLAFEHNASVYKDGKNTCLHKLLTAFEEHHEHGVFVDGLEVRHLWGHHRLSGNVWNAVVDVYFVIAENQDRITVAGSRCEGLWPEGEEFTEGHIW